MAFQAQNPATGEVIETCPVPTADDVEAALSKAHRAAPAWRARSIGERAVPMKRMAQLLREQAAEHARTMAREMGKPIAQGEAEVEKCALVCAHYAEHAATMLAPEPRDVGGEEAFVRFDPLGLILAVMPWNFPFWQVYRFAAPALMAGNLALLKHAESVPGCARALEGLFREAGFPEGTFQAPLLVREQVPGILADARVAAATLTGSERAGKSVGEHAGRALKKVVLELGGSDPFVILADADLARAAKVAAESRLINGGQSCIAAKRFIAVDAVHDRFLEAFVEAMRAVQPGDPMQRETKLGPMARLDLRDELHRQVRESVERGAVLRLGGAVPAGPGAFYPATVLAEVRPGMPAYDEETFGPVASVIRARDEEDALRIANDTTFGLGAAVWTRDTARGKRLAERIDAGCVFVNGMVKSDPRVPFGGVKRSGHGRELDAVGMRELVNQKTVWVAK
jgi:succinate-semialdehyde dehydrogenase / glutarate-semialdehyde dehydrogenase